MKRTALSRGASVGPDGRKRFSTFKSPVKSLSRGGGLTRSRMRRGPRRAKASWRRGYLPAWMTAPDAPKYTPFELAWFAFVRRHPCFAAKHGDCEGDIVAAHITLSANEKGTAMKVPHDHTAALCCRHHDFWDGRLGRKDNPWAGWSKESRYALGRTWVAVIQKAAVPGSDDRAHALDLDDAGLGRVVGDGAAGWNWWPGPWLEVYLGALIQ